MHRIILWGTGFVGKAVLKSLVGHPAFEIAGVLVHDPAKDGLDVGDIVGMPRTGVIASCNVAEMLSRQADAVAYFGPNMMHAEANMANIEAALRAGKNVVDTSMGIFHYPPLIPAEYKERITRACEAGGTSFLSNGIDPGFANDLFPMTLLGLCGQVSSVRTTEFIDGGSYPDQASLRFMGLYSRMDETPPLLANPGMMTGIWGGPLYMIAQAVGVRIERTQENYTRWAGDRAVDFAQGRVLPGEAAAHRIELQGIVGGEPRIIIDHIHRLYPDAAPEWPRPRIDDTHANRVEIMGRPNILQETVLSDADTGDGNGGGCLATGMRVLNAIPAVCAAAPGILSALDLPVIPGHGVIRADALARGKSGL